MPRTKWDHCIWNPVITLPQSVLPRFSPWTGTFKAVPRAPYKDGTQ